MSSTRARSSIRAAIRPSRSTSSSPMARSAARRSHPAPRPGVNEAVELRDGDKARYGGKGVLRAVEQRHRHDRAGDLRSRRVRPSRHRRASVRPRRHGQQGRARRERDPRRLARRAPMRRPPRSICRSIAISAGSAPGPCRSRSSTSSTAASTPRTRPTSRSSWSRRSASRHSARRCAPGAEVFAALRGDPPRRRSRDRPGRRGRVRAVAADERGRRRGHPARHREGRLPARRGRRDRTRPGDQLDPRRGDRRRRRDRPVPARARGPDPRLGRAHRPLGALGRRYPIISLEDGLAEEDWAGWRELNARLGGEDPARR